jgi:hypothetical protein
MKSALLLLFAFPLMCFAQKKTIKPILPMDSLIISKQERSYSKQGVANNYQIDSVFFTFAITYPAKYKASLRANIILFNDKDTIVSAMKRVGYGSNALTVYVPAKYDTCAVSVFISEAGKPRKSKSAFSFTLIRRVITPEIPHIVCQLPRRPPPEAMKLKQRFINPNAPAELIKTHHYTVDQLVIRTIPGVN